MFDARLVDAEFAGGGGKPVARPFGAEGEHRINPAGAAAFQRHGRCRARNGCARRNRVPAPMLGNSVERRDGSTLTFAMPSSAKSRRNWSSTISGRRPRSAIA
jgi:hypothetical protein